MRRMHHKPRHSGAGRVVSKTQLGDRDLELRAKGDEATSGQGTDGAACCFRGRARG